LTLESNLKRIIGDIWYVRDNFDAISRHKGVLERARSVEEITSIVVRSDYAKKTFCEKLVFDNYLGSLQHFLTGYDLFSMHLSSKAMEVAFLMKIETPTPEESKNLKGRVKTFEALRSIAIDRGLVKTQEGIHASRRVIDRRNMAVHDAILKQAVEIEQEKWMERIQRRLPEDTRKFLVPILFAKVRQKEMQWKTLPDFGWYVTEKSYSVTRRLLQDFFEILDRKIDEFTLFSDKSLMAIARQLPQKIKDMQQSILQGEADFIKHCARENLKDVKAVLDDIYDNRFFAQQETPHK
jgi:hypothetical protein